MLSSETLNVLNLSELSTSQIKEIEGGNCDHNATWEIYDTEPSPTIPTDLKDAFSDCPHC